MNQWFSAVPGTNFMPLDSIIDQPRLDYASYGLTAKPSPKPLSPADILRGIQPLLTTAARSVSLCGRCVIPVHRGGNGHATLTVHEPPNGRRSTSLGGVYRCGTSRCPVCAEQLARVRADELYRQFQSNMPAGCGLRFITLTQSHALIADDPEAAFESAKERDAAAWSSFRHNLGGLVCVAGLDLTAGDTFHLHRHLVVAVSPGVDADAVSERIIDRWLAAVHRKGGTAERAGQHWSDIEEWRCPEGVEPLHRALWYVVSGTVRPAGRDGGRSLRDLQRDAAGGDGDAAELMVAVTTGLHRRRLVTASAGLSLTPESDGEASTCDDIATLAQPDVTALHRAGKLPAIERAAAAMRHPESRRVTVHRLLFDLLPYGSWGIFWQGYEHAYYQHVDAYIRFTDEPEPDGDWSA